MKNKNIVLFASLLIIALVGPLLYSTTLSGAPQNGQSGDNIVTITNDDGVQIEVNLPVQRIVCLTMIEIVQVLGAGEKIVGRSSLTSDVEAIFPQSILDLPEVGTDMAPNLELILELEPDLVLSSARLSEESQKKLQDAGIVVLTDTLMWPRRNECVHNLGLILEAEAQAIEFIEYETYYTNLVSQRVANLDRNQMPLVFFEWYQPWFSTGPGATYDEMIVAGGGINIAENTTVVNPDLSPEFIAEQNPEVIIRMSTFMDGLDLPDFQKLQTNILNRPILRETTAVKQENVFILKDTLLVGRQAIGLLYLSKYLHPTLFEDINPDVIHADYIQNFFGAELTGVFAYP